jgi:hypothetical protein
MKNFRYFLLLTVSSLGLSTAPAFSREVAYEQAAPQQRRSDLRLALMAPLPQEGQQVQGRERTREEGAAARQLSDQDRANLRQQLRQQRRDGQSERP